MATFLCLSSFGYIVCEANGRHVCSFVPATRELGVRVGVQDATQELQRAIDQCPASEQQPSRLRVMARKPLLIGAVTLKSHLTLDIAHGTKLVASVNVSGHMPVPPSGPNSATYLGMNPEGLTGSEVRKRLHSAQRYLESEFDN